MGTRVRQLLAVAALVVALQIAANAFVSGRTTALRAWTPRALDRDAVAIVPGANVYKGRPAPMLAQRLETALSLYRAGTVSRILVSGNEDAGEVSAMSAWLAARGVAGDDVLRDPHGERTLETMRNAALRFNVRAAVVCTQGVFLDRALFLAREAGLAAVGAETARTRLPRTLVVREALKTTLAVVEVYVLGRLDRAPVAAVALAAPVR